MLPHSSRMGCWIKIPANVIDGEESLVITGYGRKWVVFCNIFHQFRYFCLYFPLFSNCRTPSTLPILFPMWESLFVPWACKAFHLSHGFGRHELGEIPALAKGSSWAVPSPSDQKIFPRVARTRNILLHSSGETGAHADAFSCPQRLGWGFMVSTGAVPSMEMAEILFHAMAPGELEDKMKCFW